MSLDTFVEEDHSRKKLTDNRRKIPSDAKSLCEPLTIVRLKGRHTFLTLYFCDQNKIYIII